MRCIFTEPIYTRFVAGNSGFVRFNKYIVYTHQNFRPLEKAFKKFDFGALNIDFHDTQIFVQILEIGNEVNLLDFDSFILTDIFLGCDNRTRLRI